MPTKPTHETIDWQKLKPGDSLVWWSNSASGSMKSHMIVEFIDLQYDSWCGRILHTDAAQYIHGRSYTIGSQHGFLMHTYKIGVTSYWELMTPIKQKIPYDRFSILDIGD